MNVDVRTFSYWKVPNTMQINLEVLSDLFDNKLDLSLPWLEKDKSMMFEAVTKEQCNAYHDTDVCICLSLSWYNLHVSYTIWVYIFYNTISDSFISILRLYCKTSASSQKLHLLYVTLHAQYLSAGTNHPLKCLPLITLTI